MKKNAVVGNLMLLTTALIWGLAFVAQSVGVDRMAPMTFQFCRSLTAVLTLIPLVAIGDRGKNDGKTFFTRFRDKRLLLKTIQTAAEIIPSPPVCNSIRLGPSKCAAPAAHSLSLLGVKPCLRVLSGGTNISYNSDSFSGQAGI